MKRRNFLILTAAVPFVGIAKIGTAVEHAEMLPHKLFLPGAVWSSLAFIGQVNNRFMYLNAVVTDSEGKRLSTAINNEWSDLPKWFSICLGIEDDPLAEHWLTGEDWDRRVRVVEAFVRNGCFSLDLHGDGVLLLREEDM